MTKRSALIVLLSAPFLWLSACSSKGKQPEYYTAMEAPNLEIPEGLDNPISASALVIQYPAIPLPSLVLDPMPPRISSTTSGIPDNSSLNWSAEGMFLLIEDSIESARRRAELVLERAGMKKITLDDQGVYRFDYYQVFGDGKDGFFSSMAFWRRDNREDYSGAYQIFLQAVDADRTRVFIKYADGTDCEPDAAEHVLAILGARLG